MSTRINGGVNVVGTIVAGCVIAFAASERSAGQVPLMTETQKLIASDGAPSDHFGTAIDREGDTLIIGAPQHYTNALPGSFYLFERNGSGVWIEQARVLSNYQPGEAVFGDLFGTSLALQGDTLLVGAPFAEQNGAMRVGRVYVFERQAGGSWMLQQILLPSSGMPSTEFGVRVAIVGDTAVIAGLFRAFVYTRDSSGVWSQQVELPGFDSGTLRTMAFDGQHVVLTRYDPETNSTPQAGLFTAGQGTWDGPELITSSLTGPFAVGSAARFFGEELALGVSDLDRPGSVFIFARDASGGWIQQAAVAYPDTSDPYPYTAGFGGAVHGEGSAMIVGAQFRNRAYVFRLGPGGTWANAAELRPTDAYQFAQNFGNAVHMAEDIAVVGSRAHHENGRYAGAAYIFAEIVAPVAGDIDGDGDADIDDVYLLLACFAGPGAPNPGCDASAFDLADFDGDSDVDLSDFAELERRVALAQ
jgi:hypothetical protein